MKLKKLLSLVLIAALVIGVYTSTCVSAKSSSIPKDAFSYNGHSYYCYYDDLSWNEAKAACEKRGGYLVTFNSEEENEKIWEYACSLVNSSQTRCFWIGLYNKGTPENPDWRWANGDKVTYSNWYYDQPNYNHVGEIEGFEAYAGMGYRGNSQWDDFVFTGNGDIHGYICEWDGYVISSNVKNISLYPGETFDIKYSVTYNGESAKNKASFKSSAKSIAKVSSKGKVVAVKPGVCEVTLSVKGAKKTIKVVVLPKTVKGLKKSNTTKKNISLTWKKQNGVAGYQISMYDPDLEEFSNVKTVSNGNTTSTTITGLESGTTYKFKIRSYIKDGSKKYYSDWSKVIKVKTSK